MKTQKSSTRDSKQKLRKNAQTDGGYFIGTNLVVHREEACNREGKSSKFFLVPRHFFLGRMDFFAKKQSCFSAHLFVTACNMLILLIGDDIKGGFSARMA